VANRENEHILCQGCKGLKGEKGEVIVGVIAICNKCKKEKEIIAKGLCRGCYDASRQAKRTAAKKAIKNEPAIQHQPEASGKLSDKLEMDFEDVNCKAVNVPPQDSAPRSLLSLITPPPEVKTEGIFLDFTDHPGLLVELEAISDDVPGDILELCSMLVQGKLREVV